MKFRPFPKVLSFLFGCLAVVGCVLAVLWVTSPNQMGKMAFAATGLPTRTLEEAKALAIQHNKPLLMDFSAYWCNVCRKLDRTVLKEESVKKHIENHYVFVRLDSEDPETRPLMKKYGIYGFPTLLVAHPDGTPIRFVPLAFEPESFIKNL